MVKITIEYDYKVLGVDCKGTGTIVARNINDVVQKICEYIVAIREQSVDKISKVIGLNKESVDKIKELID